MGFSKLMASTCGPGRPGHRRCGLIVVGGMLGRRMVGSRRRRPRSRSLPAHSTSACSMSCSDSRSAARLCGPADGLPQWCDGGPDRRDPSSPIREATTWHNDWPNHRGLRRHLVSLRPRRVAGDRGAALPGPAAADVAIWVRAWPLELVNGAPLDPTVTWEHAEDLREQVAPDLFRHLDVDRFPSSTLDALALANRAYRTDLQVGERVSFALRDALFEEGRDISDRVTLEHLAQTSESSCLTSPTAPLWRRTGRRVDDVESSARRTSSVVTPTCSALRSTSPRTPSRGCRSSGTSRV